VLTVMVNTSPAPTREEKLDARINAILNRPSYSRYLGWAWWEVRQEVGGNVKSEEFREAIERLLALGLVVECYMKSYGPEPTHRFMSAVASKFIDPATLISIRGRRDLIEPYFRSSDGPE
jgi:hypothetical protein